MAIAIKGGGDPLGRDAPTAGAKKKPKPAKRSPAPVRAEKAPAVSDQSENLNTTEKSATTSLLLRLPTDLVDRLTAERFRRKAATRTDLIRALLEEALKP